MMVVTVEVWPGGRKANRYIIDQMAFANRSQLAEDSTYDVWVDGGPGSDWRRAPDRALEGYTPDITGLRHTRSDGGLALTRKALNQMEDEA